MKLSVLMMSALLALSSAALQEEEGENPPPEEDLEESLPEVSLIGSSSTLQTPVHIQENGTGESCSSQNSSLVWWTMAGSIPSGAVFTRISSTGRTDFVCSYRGAAGFYNPRVGRSCHYPFKGRERLGSPFQILVKTNSSEVLTWKADSWGRVPNNSVTACSERGLYVGRNRGGLGTVSVGLKAFRLPRNHREYRFRSYQVLTFN